MGMSEEGGEDPVLGGRATDPTHRARAWILEFGGGEWRRELMLITYCVLGAVLSPLYIGPFIPYCVHFPHRCFRSCFIGGKLRREVRLLPQGLRAIT